ncbi:hypothetical protein C1886_24260 [Pseudomonas sp. FW300-N1A1]|uniref:DUF6953 family protein n=1 Tax=Pseudomonas sp. FW300-N1A1 TaxID=2075555 RepID=UPI000CD22848|nr:hypothetical protein [Pseudomonas sp. FW300-N1A1]POA17003.1 hypothetical protein C1886_24260 [Pseudomonas sp. FW300-N1A1]
MTWTDEDMRIAQWMLAEYRKQDCLPQSLAAREIRLMFGEAHVYRNRHGNWAVNKPILESFKALTAEYIVWSRGFQLWRPRTAQDPTDIRVSR